MYLARNSTNELTLFKNKPSKFDWPLLKAITWVSQTPGEGFDLDPLLYPEVKFENSPVEVEITLKPSKPETPPIRWVCFQQTGLGEKPNHVQTTKHLGNVIRTLQVKHNGKWVNVPVVSYAEAEGWENPK